MLVPQTEGMASRKRRAPGMVESPAASVPWMVVVMPQGVPTGIAGNCGWLGAALSELVEVPSVVDV